MTSPRQRQSHKQSRTQCVCVCVGTRVSMRLHTHIFPHASLKGSYKGQNVKTPSNPEWVSVILGVSQWFWKKPQPVLEERHEWRGILKSVPGTSLSAVPSSSTLISPSTLRSVWHQLIGFCEESSAFAKSKCNKQRRFVSCQNQSWRQTQGEAEFPMNYGCRDRGGISGLLSLGGVVWGQLYSSSWRTETWHTDQTVVREKGTGRCSSVNQECHGIVNDHSESELLFNVSSERQHLLWHSVHCGVALGVIKPEGRSPPTGPRTPLPAATWFFQEVSDPGTNPVLTRWASAFGQELGVWCCWVLVSQKEGKYGTDTNPLGIGVAWNLEICATSKVNSNCTDCTLSHLLEWLLARLSFF